MILQSLPERYDELASLRIWRPFFVTLIFGFTEAPTPYFFRTRLRLFLDTHFYFVNLCHKTP